MAVCGLPTGNALRLAPMPAIVISRGNDGAQMSWGRRDRDYLSLGDRALVNPYDDLGI